jgi:hypothetical protein
MAPSVKMTGAKAIAVEMAAAVAETAHDAKTAVTMAPNPTSTGFQFPDMALKKRSPRSRMICSAGWTAFHPATSAGKPVFATQSSRSRASPCSMSSTWPQFAPSLPLGRFEPLVAHADDDDATRLAISRETNRRMREAWKNSALQETTVVDEMPESHRQANNFLRAGAQRGSFSVETSPYVPPAPTFQYQSHDDRTQSAYLAYLREHKPHEYDRYMKEQEKIEALRGRRRR